MPPDSVLISSTSSFRKLAKTGKIVDKSNAIRDFLADDSPVHLLLRPRRSGKTTLLHMFQIFFERGDPDALEERKDMFIKNNLAITHEQDFDQEFGMYPVLYVNLANVNGDTFIELEEKFRTHVNEIALDLEERGLLANLDRLSKKRRKFLEGVLAAELTPRDWTRALLRLTQVLQSIHEQDVIVLVDEYDTPTSYATQHGYFTEVSAFFREVFSPLLKDNECLRGALLVGILQVAKAGWLSGINNLNVYTLGQSGNYSTSCMFTETETLRLYEEQKKKRLAGISFTFEELSKWYNGYNSGDGESLYNPWSIARALKGNKLRSYWVKSGYDQVVTTRILHFLGSDDQFREQVEKLIMDEPVSIELDEVMTYSSVLEMSRRQLWTFLYSTGYLTLKFEENQGPIIAQIPNYEIRFLYHEWLRDHLRDYVNKSGNLTYECANIFQNMVSGRMALFAKGFSKLIWRSMPTQFLGCKEYVYQAWVSGFFAIASQSASPTWVVDVEHCSGTGRLDLRLLSDDEAVIHEYKRIKLTKKEKQSGYTHSQRKRLTKAAEKGMEQIEIKGHRARLPYQVIKLREFGIAFLGPYCGIVGRSLEREPGGEWRIIKLYLAEKNERHRDRLYHAS